MDKRDLPLEEEEEEEDDRNLNYNPPAHKTLQEIRELDKDDESLVKYKQTLLGTRPMMAGVWMSATCVQCACVVVVVVVRCYCSSNSISVTAPMHRCS